MTDPDSLLIFAVVGLAILGAAGSGSFVMGWFPNARHRGWKSAAISIGVVTSFWLIGTLRIDGDEVGAWFAILSLVLVALTLGGIFASLRAGWRLLRKT